ncbi:MAG: deoxyribose-phosphate aldolase [Planctomycetota bacterium]|nr:MAG: deoxyribose-phosphate aldolase [Planctomycetota bacterium]
MSSTSCLPGLEPGAPLPPSLRVDEAGLKARARELASRSLKRETKREGLARAISMIDLTTLEGADTPGRVRSLCRRAIQPEGAFPEIPSVAAVCVYPNLVELAVQCTRGTPVQVAAVASGFPAGQVPLPVKLADTRAAVEAGATEIDIVIDRNAFLRGDWSQVFDEIAALKEAAAGAELKVILETGELGSFDAISRASWIACEAGADFIKTSTGKVSVNSTPATALCMLQVVRDYQRLRDRRVGVKVAGGVRKSKEALHYLVLVHETLGPDWLSNRYFRIGASSLLGDLVRQWMRMDLGRYVADQDVSQG